MTTGQWIILDDAVALLSAAAWFAAGVTAALGRAQGALGLLAAAVLVSLARIATVAMLAGRGWWFVQEKVLLGLPMLAAGGLAAVLIAGPTLREARRTPSNGLPARSVVALLSAAYAAAAGFVVTLLIGFPLTWSTALITVSLVCTGALLTARVLAVKAAVAAAGDAPVNRQTGEIGAGVAAGQVLESRVSRRRFIRVAGVAVVVGAGASGVGVSLMPVESVTTGGGRVRSAGSRPTRSVADLRGAGTPASGGTRQQHVLTARTARVRLPSGREVDAWAYNGQVPGPPITVTQGDLVEVALRNTDIQDGVTVHWHGYDVACGEDGVPGLTQNIVAPGEEFVYRFRADQVGTYWYHTHQVSDRGVRKGLYGTLVVTPRIMQQADAAPGQVDLTLPVHTFDGTVVIGDSDQRTEHAVSAGAPVRLRLINTDSQPHHFALAGTPFRVAAVDGRDLHGPGEVSDVRLRLAASGRYDLVFVMPDRSVALVCDNDRDGGLRLRAQDDPTGAGPGVEDTSGWPELDLLHYGTAAAVPFDTGAPDRHFTMVLDRGVAMVDGAPTYAQTVNGRGHPSIPDQLVTEGDVVRFTVVNRSLETHPWHLHGHPVLILSRNRTPSSGSPLWMDTFDVRPGEVWDVAFKAANPGIWMNHCHNLPHADQGMMLRLRYDGVTTPFAHPPAAHAHHHG
ncbi:multicopper oxidase family protein [Dactylosporangium sp. NPDC049140]|uniref:multicopper oxidase family protein n=1 Tax=Dactylosporangium sp. NPDC049140 TaxID=3155647 RepID=UPI0033C53E4B